MIFHFHFVQPTASLVYGGFIEIGTLGHHISEPLLAAGGGQRTGRRLGDTDNCQWSQASSVVSGAKARSCPAPAREQPGQLVTTQLGSCSRVV